MKYTINKNYLLGIIIISFMLLLLFYLFIVNLKSVNQIHTLEDKWHILYNGSSYSKQPNDKLDKFVLPKTKRGDVIELEYKLEDLNINNAGLVFDTWHSKTEVYLSDEKIYTWGTELYEKNKLLGAKRHKISLPQNYNGKKLKIVLTSSEPEAMSRMESVAIFSIDDNNIIWFNRPLIIVFSGTLYLIVGFLAFIFSCITLLKTDKFISSIALGATLFIMGLYFLCRTKVMPLLVSDQLVYNQIEFLSLYLLPLFLLIYSYNIHNSNKSKGIKILYNCYLAFYSCLLFIAFLLNNLTSIHYSVITKYYYILTIPTYLVIYYILKKADPTNRSHWVKITKMAIKIFFIGSFVSIIVFNLKSIPEINKNINTWEVYEYILSGISFAMLFFFFIGFYLNIKNSFILEYENNQLSYIAKHDMMTKLENRHSFNEKLDSLKSSEKGISYSIIIMDLNGLKHVNDNYGHLEGDKLITDLAKIILKSSNGNTSSYRIGGDEFAVLLKDINDHTTFNKNLNKNIEKYNSQNSNYQINLAVGTANTEDSNDPYEIVRLADQRMYEVKKEMKKNSPKNPTA